MERRKRPGERLYDTYEPYPVTREARGESYEGRRDGTPSAADSNRPDRPNEDPLLDLIGEAGPSDWSLPEPLRVEQAGGLRPLATLRSLFSDRLELLQASLRELEAAERERRQLTNSALEDIDSTIADCDSHLAVFRSHRGINDLERRKHLERQLLELKRQRRHESLLSWRDLLALRREIKSLQREIASVAGTLPSARKTRSPGQPCA